MEEKNVGKISKKNRIKRKGLNPLNKILLFGKRRIKEIKKMSSF